MFSEYLRLHAVRIRAYRTESRGLLLAGALNGDSELSLWLSWKDQSRKLVAGNGDNSDCQYDIVFFGSAPSKRNIGFRACYRHVVALARHQCETMA
jgi:hypothetical protein